MFKINWQIPHAVFVVILVLVALGIRIVDLGSLPRIFNPDEAAIAYNAYLLAETGLDEWGEQWPITLQSFGDYKLIGYPTIVAGLFQVFVPSEFLVRLPAAVAGTSLVLIGLFWSKWLGHTKHTQLLVAAAFAITPVFFFYSRMAFEALVALAFLVTALRIFFQRSDSPNTQLGLDLIACLLFAAACLIYNTPLLLLPFILISIVWWRGAFAWRSWIVPVGVLLVTGMIMYVILSDATSQKSAVTIFGDLGQREKAITFSQRVPQVLQPLASAYTYYAGVISQHIVRSFGVSFLVIRGGGHPWHALPLWGHVLFVQYALSLLGLSSALLLFLSSSLHGLKRLLLQPLSTQQHGTQILLLFLTFAGLAPAVVTVDAPHATRSLLFFFCFILLMGEGAQKLQSLVASRFPNPSQWIYPIITLLLMMSAASYFWAYFFWFPSNHTNKMPVGFDIAIREAAKAYPEQEVAIVDPEGNLYIYASWYLRYTPEEFFATVRKQLPTHIGFRYGERVGQFHFIADLQDRTTERAVIYRQDSQWISIP